MAETVFSFLQRFDMKGRMSFKRVFSCITHSSRYREYCFKRMSPGGGKKAATVNRRADAVKLENNRQIR